MRTVSGLDVHKDSIFMCILGEQGKKTEEKFGVTTHEIKRMGLVMKSLYVHDSLEGCVSQSDRDLLKQYTKMTDMYETQKQQCIESMVEM